MPERDDHKEITRVTARVLAVAERWLHAADQVDYVVRRWLIPVPVEKATRSVPHQAASIQRSGLSNDIQNAIGQQLRAQYAVEQAVPARFANLLKEFEQRSNKAEAVGRSSYASAA
jgi:hypothetical protein